MNVPECVVFIPDGNRRDESEQDRSKQGGVSRAKLQIAKAGHARGLVNCRRNVQACFDLGVKNVVVWGASESNLRSRDAQEIAFLYKLLKGELRYRARNKDPYGFRICGLWNMTTTDPELPKLVKEAHERTAKNTTQVLTLLFGYDGETEYLEACKKALGEEGRLDKRTVHKYLWTSHVPSVDLIIRTGCDDDPHQSDLLLPVQSKNAQLYFTKTRWPAFGAQELKDAFENFSTRARRKGV